MSTIKKLSENIQSIIDHCPTCHGSGEWIDSNCSEPLACLYCSDWMCALRDVLKLENEIHNLKNELNNLKKIQP